MQQQIPKQFLCVNGKPILAYTIAKFQFHPRIDSITIVCTQGWEDFTREICLSNDLSKVKHIVQGGATALDSIKRGVETQTLSQRDIVIIHDGVRPLVDEESINAVIEDCERVGGAISSIPTIEHIAFQGDNQTSIRYLDRGKTFRTLTPQAYYYGNISDAYKILEEKGIGKDSSFIGTLMMDVGKPICLSKGSEKNIKITSPIDLELFKLALKDESIRK